jgi:hypothetical protein
MLNSDKALALNAREEKSAPMSIRRIILALCATVLPALALSACADESPVGPKMPPKPEAPAALGVVEITISGIGTGEMIASAAAVAPGRSLPRGVNFDLIPIEGIGADPGAGTPAEGGIQLVPLSTGSFTEGEGGAEGMRYLWATYRVRNATTKGTAYQQNRRNLTFLAIDDNATIGQTAISVLHRFDGSKADDAIAPTILPTGAALRNLDTGAIVSSSPDVLQILTEAEIAEINAPAGVSIFPYGFVVNAPIVGGARQLASNPAEDDFEGVVTFAFKLPLQTNAADDPFMISFRALAVEDTETRITQSLEEQDDAGEAAFLARAADLGATTLTVLSGTGYTGGSSRSICSVRTAGTADSPTGYLIDDCEAGARTWLGLGESELHETTAAESEVLRAEIAAQKHQTDTLKRQQSAILKRLD